MPPKLTVPYGAEFVYQPGGTPVGNVYTDPNLLANVIQTAGVPPSTIYIDCTFVSPAPWPVDLFLPGVAYVAADVLAPAIIGLTGDGALWFPSEMDGVGLVNVSSTTFGAMVNVGQIFGQTFKMKNGAYIQRASDADLLGLFIVADPSFDLQIENCPNPFPNIANPASTQNVKFFGAGGLPGRVLDLLLTVGGPKFVCNSFQSAPAGSILNVNYDNTIPESQTIFAAWTGTVTPTQLAQAGSVTYSPAAPGDWVAPPPTTVQAAIDRIAAVVSAGGVTPIP